jgi:D-alanine-D-alanine ligase
MDKKKIIGLVMGGPSAESHISLITGRSIAIALRDKGYTVREIELDPYNFQEQLKQSGTQVVFNAVHGLYGEDGRLQSVLEMLGMPYTGSGVCASAIAMDKFATKRVLLGSGIPTPKSLFLYRRDKNQEDQVARIREVFHLPVVIKPADQGSSLGMTIVKEEGALAEALDLAYTYSYGALVEAYITGGGETTVCMLERNGTVEVLPIILIKPHAEYYDYKAKYTAGGADHLCPAPLPEKILQHLREISVAAYKAIGCSGVARADCMLDASGRGYVLEMNTVPGMTPTSLVPDAAAVSGITFGDLCELILNSAHR